MLCTAVPTWAQTPSGRWDGVIKLRGMDAPFTLILEGAGHAVTGSFVNGESRVSSTSGSFENGTLRLRFPPAGASIEAILAGGELKGRYSSGAASHPLTASAYCTCAYEGEAGPDISGGWEVPAAKWRLTLRRIGEDTLAIVERGEDRIGPLTGRFNGVSFELKYFDGKRAAVLEAEPAKDGALGLAMKEPGVEPANHKAVRASGRK